LRPQPVRQQTRGFTPDRVDTAVVFAAHAQLLLMNIDNAGKVHNLNQALTTSRLIVTAIGILMFADQIGEDEAFDRLIRASQNLNRKLSDIAREVTPTGALPHGHQPA
jgi:AmiR/NasT family two-component response regulator